MSIAKEICDKPYGWISEGAVRHSDEAQANEKGFLYPKVGMKFIGQMTTTKLPECVVSKWKYGEFVNENGIYKYKYKQKIDTKLDEKNINYVTFKVEQKYIGLGGSVPEYDPAKNYDELTSVFPSAFLDAYSNTRFFEIGSILVSQPLIVPTSVIPADKSTGLPTVVTFHVEIHEHDNHRYMLQRSFWNGVYVGTYCCS